MASSRLCSRKLGQPGVAHQILRRCVRKQFVAGRRKRCRQRQSFHAATCFRTADSEFHGFEGSWNTYGCCFGNCTHVWNYETVTPFLFPAFARSLRKSAFGYSMDEAGAMHFRQLLPDGKARSTNAAADGQMGQIVHA